MTSSVRCVLATTPVNPRYVWTSRPPRGSAGNRFIGRYRLGGAVEIASPLGLGDLLDLRVLSSGDELQSGRIGYRVPLGVDGLTLNSSFSAVRYQLKDEFAPLRAEGSALMPSLSLSYPLFRLPRMNLYVRGGADYTSLRDDTDSPPTSADRALWSVFGGLYGDWRDAVGAGAVSAFTANIENGELDIHSDALRRFDRATTRAAGAFQKYTYSLLRLQSLGGPWSVYASLAGQFASQNLDSSEKFWLGGAQRRGMAVQNLSLPHRGQHLRVPDAVGAPRRTAERSRRPVDLGGLERRVEQAFQAVVPQPADRGRRRLELHLLGQVDQPADVVLVDMAHHGEVDGEPVDAALRSQRREPRAQEAAIDAARPAVDQREPRRAVRTPVQQKAVAMLGLDRLQHEHRGAPQTDCMARSTSTRPRPWK